MYVRPPSSKIVPKSIVQVFDVPQTEVTCINVGTRMVSTCCAFLRLNTDEVRQMCVYCILQLLFTGLMSNKFLPEIENSSEQENLFSIMSAMQFDTILGW